MTQTETISHINHALVPKTHPQMYLMHKYWARKPHNVVAEYIEHYTRPNDIVLDPFMGSGVTVLEAIRLKRRAVGFDLDPISNLIVEVTANPPSLAAIDDAFSELKSALESRINDLYVHPCPKCQKKGTIEYVVWSYVVECPICDTIIVMAEVNRPKGKRQNIYKCNYCKQEFSYANVPIEDEEPIFLKMECSECGQTSKIKKPHLKTPPIDLKSVTYPKIRFKYDGNKPFATKRRANTIEELYTDRNLYSMSLLHQSIAKIVDEPTRRTFECIFSSMVPQTSRLVPWRREFATGGPAWTVPEYLILPVHCEFNVWSRFENRFKSVRRGIENRMQRLPSELVNVEKYDDLQRPDQFWNGKVNALDLSHTLPENSVDYVFTDPPYGGSIQYFELDLIRAAWLMDRIDDEALQQWWKEEITICKGQGKNFEYYHKMLSASFSEVFRVLKPNHYLTVTFHSTDIDVWNSIIIAVRNAGFELEKILYQSPAVRSARESLQPWGSAVGDYYIRFRKPEEKKPITQEQVDRNKYRHVVLETTKGIIAERGEPTPYTFILNGIIPALDKNGVFFLDKHTAQKELRKS